MSEATPKPQRTGGGAGRVILWIVLAVFFVLAAIGSIALIRVNPLYSNAERNGLSKYKFIDECKNLLQENLDKAQAQDKGAPITFDMNAQAVVRDTVQNPQKGGWGMSTPVLLHREGYGSQTLPFACAYEKGGKVQLVSAQQAQ